MAPTASGSCRHNIQLSGKKRDQHSLIAQTEVALLNALAQIGLMWVMAHGAFEYQKC